MAEPFLLQGQFLGMDQDSSRDSMRASSVFNSVDYIPNRLGAPLRKRGGWSQTPVSVAGATYIDSITHSPYSAGALLQVVASDTVLYDGFSGASYGSVGFTSAQNPVFFNNASVFLDRTAAATPKVYDTSAGLAVMGGTPPTAKYGCGFKGRLALAQNDKVYFAPSGWGPGAYSTWDTTNAVSPPLGRAVTGMAPTSGAILVFHDALVNRLRGSIPFGTTNSDMVIEPLWGGVGCADARSIVSWNEQVLWADLHGVYQSDGAALRDLTAVTGMKTQWQTLMASYQTPLTATSGYRIAGGIFRDHYYLAVTNGTAFVDCFVFDLQHNIAWRFSNFNFRCMARSTGITEELYLGRANGNRIGNVSTTWTPSNTNYLDGDGTAITPVLETSYFKGWTRFHRRWVPSQGIQRWHYLYVTYECSDPVAFSPSLTMSLATAPDQGSTYATTLSPTLATTTKYTRVRIPVRLPANGIALKLAQSAASADTRIYAIEADYAPVEGSRLG